MYVIYDDSKNYTCQVIKLPVMQAVEGLDNLMKVNVQGNNCLVGKDSNPDELYLFFPAESQISHEFLHSNNLYRDASLNADPEQKGFFEKTRRVKAVKFRGVISSGFVIPLEKSLCYSSEFGELSPENFAAGDEFNEINGVMLCKKYIARPPRTNTSLPKTKILDEIVDAKLAPEHMDTAHVLRNLDKIHLKDYIAITYKLHGTSARYFHTLVKKNLSWKDKVAKWFGVNVVDEHYDYVTGSRKVIKSVGFETLPGKNHFFTEDLWSKVGKEFFDGRLHKGEAVYCEIIGSDYTGAAIQKGYTYGLAKPKVYIYRISMINSQGIEVDLPYTQMLERAAQLGLEVCPEYWYGTLEDFFNNHYGISANVYKHIYAEKKDEFLAEILESMLEQPSILDGSVVEEGFCIRIEKYPKPEIYKIKAKSFLLHEGNLKDKDIVDIEEQESVIEE